MREKYYVHTAGRDQNPQPRFAPGERRGMRRSKKRSRRRRTRRMGTGSERAPSGPGREAETEVLQRPMEPTGRSGRREELEELPPQARLEVAGALARRAGPGAPRGVFGRGGGGL